MKLDLKRTSKFWSLFFSFTIPFYKRTIRFYWQLYDSPNSWVVGWSSRTQEGKYVLFQDYDDLELQDICDELHFLQNKFGLSEYYVFQLPDRKNSYHAVCLDTFSIADAYDILKHSSCDTAFINSVSTLRSKEWILRLGRKGNRCPPKYLFKVIPSRQSSHKKSSAHAELLRKMKIIVLNSGNWDNCKKLSIVKYNTANRTLGEV